MPITLENVLIEKADATVADAHGSWGEAIDVFAVQEVVLKLLFREQMWRFAIELSQQAYFADIGLLSPFAFATELKRGKHLLTQWGHKRSPFLEWTSCLFEKADIVEGRKPRRERDKITAASAAYLNIAVELTGKTPVFCPQLAAGVRPIKKKGRHGGPSRTSHWLGY